MTEALSETRSLRSHPRRGARPRRTDYRLLLAVCAGGTAGGVSRAAVEKVFPVGVHGWPWATFVVNVVGTLLLGYFATRLQERLPPSTFRRPLLGTGFCGALTTFSTFQIELLELVRHDRARRLQSPTSSRASSPGLAAISPRDGRVRAGRGCDERARLARRRRCSERVGALLRFELDGLVQRRAAGEFPVGTLVVNVARLVLSRPARPGSPSPATRCCSPARRCSARSRRSRPGCSRPSGSPRTARRASRSRNLAVAVAAGLARRRRRVADRRPRCERRLPEADGVLRRVRPCRRPAPLRRARSTCSSARRCRPSVLLRAVEGFGIKHTLRTQRFLTLSEDLPLVAVAVDERTADRARSCRR